MATWRSIFAGGSFGRGQGVVNWLINNFGYFDAWCCAKNVDPLDLSAYRLYNLAVYCLKENLDTEALTLLDQQLMGFDHIKNPLTDFKIKKVKAKILSNEPQSIKPKEKYEYIPPWWQPNEEAAYANAQVAIQGINKLPKMA